MRNPRSRIARSERRTTATFPFSTHAGLYENTSQPQAVTGLHGPLRSNKAGFSMIEHGEKSRQVIEKIGGASRDRTDDLIVANDALSQLSYSPMRGWVIDCPTILSAFQNRHQPDRRPARALRLVQLSARNPLDEIPRFTSNYHLAATENVCRRNRLMFAQLNLVTTRRQRWLRMGSLALHGLLLAPSIGPGERPSRRRDFARARQDAGEG